VSSKTRKAIAAGRFYPKDIEGINNQIRGFLPKDFSSKINAVACMVPHAGYVYSGRVAVNILSQINIPNLVIMLGPNHTGIGSPYSIMSSGSWQTPLGEVKVDGTLAKLLLSRSRYLIDDERAHNEEHSLEVELPILQYFNKRFEIVPISFMPSELSVLQEIGKEIASAIEEYGCKGKVLILASSDMTHYESQEDAVFKDKKAIDAMLSLDEKKLLQEVAKLNISMCGLAPVVVMLSCIKCLGALKGILTMYQTSADVTKDKESVVGYAGIIFN